MGWVGACRGLIGHHHNGVCDSISSSLTSHVWGNVVHKHVICKQYTSSDSAQIDVLRGMWIPQTEALFDIHVVDTDTQSYNDYSYSFEHEKKYS